MFPQTLAIAQWLLYLDGLFAIIGYLDRTNVFGAWRSQGGIGGVVAPFACISFVAGGFLLANGKMFGWFVAVGASVSPFVLRVLWKLTVNDFFSWQWVLTQGSLISMIFEVALIALLVHPMSRSYIKIWLR